MIEIGRKQTLKIGRTVDFGVYLTKDGEEVLLPQKYLPESFEIGDELEVFVYKDQQNRPVAVTTEPKGQVGDIIGAEVTHVTDFGAFIDIGLEKDVLVPKKEQSVDMEVGRTYVVKLLIDHMTERMVATAKLHSFINEDTSVLKGREKVEVLVWHKTDLGFKVIINQEFEGLIYENEIFERLRAGDVREGYIKEIRPDGKVDVTIQPRGYEAVMDSSAAILNILEENGGEIDLGDKSDPDEIKAVFEMSKKNFKKVLGGLYKAGRIEIYDHRIVLKK
ncbi:S1 RNA-binding domain-containing protein [Roseivirga pacifica]|uniref:CvfB family protein n=1 Tax=Roseivirga pacifica TaxID=1267423 RepID=UPI003BA8C519